MLVQRTVAGDQKAFELLVIKYQRRIERLIGRMVRDADLVEDIAQETFIRAYRALAPVPGRGAVLHLAVPDRRQYRQEGPGRHEARPDRLRERLAGRRDDEDETYRPWKRTNQRETPETVLAAKEIAAAVNAAMEALPDELRQAVTLREIEGMSYEEIAEVMNCPIGTVRSRIFRAREAISAKVKPMLENQSGKRW